MHQALLIAQRKDNQSQTVRPPADWQRKRRALPLQVQPDNNLNWQQGGLKISQRSEVKCSSLEWNDSSPLLHFALNLCTDGELMWRFQCGNKEHLNRDWCAAMMSETGTAKDRKCKLLCCHLLPQTSSPKCRNKIHILDRKCFLQAKTLLLSHRRIRILGSEPQTQSSVVLL